MAFPKLAERDVVSTITDFLKAEQWKCIRLQSGKFRGEYSWITMNKKGTPDWLCLRPMPDGGLGYQSFFLEAKRGGKKATKEQVLMHIDLRRDGYVVLVADSWDAFKSEYDKRGYK